MACVAMGWGCAWWGCAWQGAYMAGRVHGGMHGEGGGGRCVHARETATEAGGTRPTGMRSCSCLRLHLHRFEWIVYSRNNVKNKTRLFDIYVKWQNSNLMKVKSSNKSNNSYSTWFYIYYTKASEHQHHTKYQLWGKWIPFVTAQSVKICKNKRDPKFICAETSNNDEERMSNKYRFNTSIILM